MRYILSIALLVIAAAPPALAQNPTETAGASQSTFAESIIANEKQLFEMLKKKDINGFKSLVASDGTVFGRNGRISMTDFNQFVFSPDYTVQSATVEDPQVMMIDKNVAIITYKTTGSQTYKGRSETGTAYASTVWVKRGEKWMAVFHQESMVPAPTAPKSDNK